MQVRIAFIVFKVKKNNLKKNEKLHWDLGFLPETQVLLEIFLRLSKFQKHHIFVHLFQKLPISVKNSEII